VTGVTSQTPQGSVPIEALKHPQSIMGFVVLMVHAMPGLLTLWVATPYGTAKCHFGVVKQIWLTN